MSYSYPVDENILIITKATVSKLIEVSPDALALYMFYVKCHKEQNTKRIYATSRFCMKVIGWSKDKFFRVKKILSDEKLIENFEARNDQGQVTKTYIKINFIPNRCPENRTSSGVPVLRTAVKSGHNTNKEINILNKKEITISFEEFWKLYPKKISKKKVCDIFIKLTLKNSALADKIIKAARAQIDWRQKKILKQEFVPEWKHPTTWLNQECWEDELTEEPESLNPIIKERIKTYFENTGREADSELIHKWKLKVSKGISLF